MHRGIYWDVSILHSPDPKRLSTTFLYITDGLEMMFVSIGLILMPIVLFVYTRENARRAVRMREMEERDEKLVPEELRSMGDRAPDFKYTL